MWFCKTLLLLNCCHNVDGTVNWRYHELAGPSMLAILNGSHILLKYPERLWSCTMYRMFQI